ncbi:hypothetical protein [Streptomyces axinellae]|uniref:Uncharacterized protein n=1 Tax=Streptomyces axinellae TaxID=552788 RepID=A0ABP6CA80_9ACTN
MGHTAIDSRASFAHSGGIALNAPSGHEGGSSSLRQSKNSHPSALRSAGPPQTWHFIAYMHSYCRPGCIDAKSGRPTPGEYEHRAHSTPKPSRSEGSSRPW